MESVRLNRAWPCILLFAAFLAVAALLLLAGPRARGEEPPKFRVVANNTPQFVVVDNRVPAATPALPTDPSQPAPAGYQWQRWPGESWKLVKISAAPEVAAPVARPFPVGPSTGRVTPAPGAAKITSIPARSAAPVQYAAPTYTLTVGSGGFTSPGCASPFG